MHVPDVEKNEFGTPFLSSAFSSAQKLAENNILMYANADVIFTQDLIEAVQRIDMPSFLMCGRRWDLDVTEEIDFKDNGWTDELHEKVKKEGEKHSLSGMDYFIFPRNLINMSVFAVGRPGWDSWFIYDMRARRILVINATDAITVVHQDHDFSHSKFSEKKKIGGPECQKNTEIAGGLTNKMTLRDVDWVLDENGLRRPDFPMRLFPMLSLSYPWRFLFLVKRRLQVLWSNIVSVLMDKVSKYFSVLTHASGLFVLTIVSPCFPLNYEKHERNQGSLEVKSGAMRIMINWGLKK